MAFTRSLVAQAIAAGDSPELKELVAEWDQLVGVYGIARGAAGFAMSYQKIPAYIARASGNAAAARDLFRFLGKLSKQQVDAIIYRFWEVLYMQTVVDREVMTMEKALRIFDRTVGGFDLTVAQSSDLVVAPRGTGAGLITKSQSLGTAAVAEGGKLALSNPRWLPLNTTAAPITKLNNLRYVSRAGKQTDGALELVGTAEGQVFVREVAEQLLPENVKILSIEELKSFIVSVDENTPIKALSKNGIKALFRGTTRNKQDGSVYPGNPNSQEYGISTSTDPIKATIFALESATLNRDYNGVVQIALVDDLSALKLSAPNRYRCEMELEIIINTSADNLSKLSRIELSTDEARILVKDIYGIELPTSISNRQYADELLKELSPSSLEKALEFYKRAMNK